MAVSDQLVTAQGNCYREILIPVICLGEMTTASKKSAVSVSVEVQVFLTGTSEIR